MHMGAQSGRTVTQRANKSCSPSSYYASKHPSSSRGRWVRLLAVVMIVFGPAAALSSMPALAVPIIPGVSTHGRAVLVVGTKRFELLLATTPAQQQLGLGHRPSMPANSGMLFVYHSDGDHCFWMKGMRFALDIIWLSPHDKVVSVERDLVPTPSPSVYCSVSEDVIELKAGQAKAANIGLGRIVKVEMPASR